MVYRKKKKEEAERIDFEEQNELDEESEEEVEDIDELRNKLKSLEEEKKKLQSSKLPQLPETWIVRDIPTQSERVLFNQKTNKAIDLHSAIATILNKIED
ncbi:MAG TPA: hypothetical protein VMX17_15360 [Candidatus Glassbacteria bacterium]|nr:hypothetical protein [Candidatus Glassbacteria bacterium]